MLAPGRRPRIGLDGQDLLAHQGVEPRLESVGRLSRERGERFDGERLAEHGGVLQDRPVGGRQPVEPGRDEGMQGRRHLEGARPSGSSVRLVITTRPPSWASRPVATIIRIVSTAYNGRPSARSRIRATTLAGRSGAMPSSSSRMAASVSGSSRIAMAPIGPSPSQAGVRGARRQGSGRRSGSTGPSRGGARGSPAGHRPTTGDPRRRMRRCRSRPVARRTCATQRTARSAAGGRLADAQQNEHPRLDPVALGLVGDVLLDHRRDRRAGGLLVIALGQVRPPPDHLAERPERDALAVGRRAATVPPTCSTTPSRYFSSSQASRLLPIPAWPTSETSRAAARGRSRGTVP